MTTLLTRIAVVTLLAAWPVLVAGQAAAKLVSPATAPVTAAAPPAAPQPQAPAAEPYSYNPEGRRDPFVSLVSRGMQPESTGKRSEGLGGLTTAEMTVTGVLQSRGNYVALVKAPDGKTFAAHVNDRLSDGTIRSITPQGMVIMQEVNDPLSLVKVKEVRKGLRASDDVKQ